MPLKEISGQFFHLDGWKPQKWDSRDKFLLTSPAQIAMLPRRVDLRPLYDLRVEDQKSLGSCTGESVTSALEAALVASTLASDNPQSKSVPQLSPLWLYAKSRIYEGIPLTDDSGCSIRNVIKVAAKQGCALESSWPYKPEDYDVVPPDALDFEAAKYKALFYFACDSDFSAMASLAQTFPVVFGMDVYDSQLTAETMATGRIPRAKDGEIRSGGHAMLKVGYDMDMEIGAGTAQASKGAWLVLNSWGDDVGESGYFYVSFACRTRDRWTIRRTG